MVIKGDYPGWCWYLTNMEIKWKIKFTSLNLFLMLDLLWPEQGCAVLIQPVPRDGYHSYLGMDSTIKPRLGPVVWSVPGYEDMWHPARIEYENQKISVWDVFSSQFFPLPLNSGNPLVILVILDGFGDLSDSQAEFYGGILQPWEPANPLAISQVAWLASQTKPVPVGPWGALGWGCEAEGDSSRVTRCYKVRPHSCITRITRIHPSIFVGHFKRIQQHRVIGRIHWESSNKHHSLIQIAYQMVWDLFWDSPASPKQE